MAPVTIASEYCTDITRSPFGCQGKASLGREKERNACQGRANLRLWLCCPGISAMPNVRIPETHFLRTVKLQYSNVNAAIVREVVQNSIDAGSKTIALTVSEEGWFEVADDGEGMTAARMETALLTFGGSAKGENSIGNFGCAKEVILFAHRRYTIHSQNIVVEGHGIEYELGTGCYRQGTKIRIEFHPEYGFNYQTFLAAAREVLADSEFAMAVTLNGEVVPGNPKGRTFRAFPWARVHCRKLPPGERTCYALVRAKGLVMFKQYLGDLDKSVIVEITGNSREIFTAMRDRLNHVYADPLQRLFNELVIDRKSFDRKETAPLLIHGDKGVINELLADEPEPRAAAPVVAGYCALQSEASTVSLARFAQAELALVPAAACRAGFDFQIKFDAGKYRRVPKRYEPAHLSQRLLRLAQLWKHCLKLVMLASGIRKRFRIGWVLADDEAAVFSDGRTGDGVAAFLLNPEHHTMPAPKAWDWDKMFTHLLVVAAHELAHIDCRYHDEEFVRRSEDLLEKAINSCGRSRAWHVQQARGEIV